VTGKQHTASVPVPRSQRASRRRGERTRQAIVEAVVRVLARDGVRGVSHRAVAAEAGVNLSQTTYYFVDRYDLVASAFAASIGGGTQELEAHWRRVFRHLGRLLAERRGPEVRVRVRDYVCDQIVGYVYRKILETPLTLAVEQHIFSEAILEPRLTELATAHRRGLLDPLVRLCELFGSEDPALDADLLLGTILRLEYEALLVPPEAVDRRRLRASVRRILSWILKLP